MEMEKMGAALCAFYFFCFGSSMVSGTSMSGDDMPMAPGGVVAVEDFLGVIQILSNGTVLRGDKPNVMPNQTFPDVPDVKRKDVLYDTAHGQLLQARMYRPAVSNNKLLPVVIYFHGGGYCLDSLVEPAIHAYCLRAASELRAVVLSVDYRLAPEHRLPAAIHDGAHFFSRLRRQAQAHAHKGQGQDPWLVESADFSRTFISGVSAGANLAHHLTVQVSSGQLDIHPICVAGYVLDSAYFGSVNRTASEEADPLPPDVEIFDKLWHMSLPVGATTDHPVANPFGPDSPSLHPLHLPPALVLVPGNDVLRDHQHLYAARLKDMGKTVHVADFHQQHHGFSVLTPFGDATDQLLQVISRFLYTPHDPAPY